MTFSIGASLFPAIWAYRHDKLHLQAILHALSTGGVKFVRIFGAVGPGGVWDGRTVDPTESTYAADVAGTLDLLGHHGMQAHVTILAGLDKLPTPAARESLVDRLASVQHSRPTTVHSWEIANESFLNGPDPAELRVLATRLRDRVPQPIALSSPAAPAYSEVADLHRNCPAANLATYHVARAPGFAPLLDAWGIASLPAPAPKLWLSNEPVGPGSSVRSEDDPRLLALAATSVRLAGGIGYVYHTLAGTYMRKPFHTTPGFEETLELLRRA